MQESEPTRLQRAVDRDPGPEVQHPRDGMDVEEQLVVEVGKLVHHPLELDVGRLAEVVLGDEAPVLLDAAHELLELEQHETPVGAELDHVAFDLLRDPPHHLGPLEHGGDVADGHEVLHLEGRQRAAHAVEARLVALEDLERLIGPGEHARDGFQGVLLAPAVHGDDGHVLGDGDDGHVELAADPLGGAVAGAGLGRRDVRVGNEVDVGTRHP